MNDIRKERKKKKVGCIQVTNKITFLLSFSISENFLDNRLNKQTKKCPL